MRSDLEWSFTLPPVDRQVIAGIESSIEVEFPESYVECAMENHGGFPSLKCLDFGGEKEKVLNSLLALSDEGAEEEVITVLGAYEMLRDSLPGKVVPFGDDPFGNYYCFDFREAPPVIVYWDHEVYGDEPEDALVQVADSFDEFLDKLYAPEE